MERKQRIPMYMWIIILAVFLWFLYVGMSIVSVLSKESTRALEKAYYEGQKDALKGDIRIMYTNGKWIWVKSPWDDGNRPLYIPND